VVKNRVEVRGVRARDVVGLLPREAADAHLDGPVDPAALHQHLYTHTYIHMLIYVLTYPHVHIYTIYLFLYL